MSKIREEAEARLELVVPNRDESEIKWVKIVLILLDALEDMRFRTYSNEARDFIAEAIAKAEQV